MYILYLIISILTTIALGNLDKYLSIKYNAQIEIGKYEAWIESFNGRIKIYKLFIILSFLPLANMGIIIITTISIILFLLIESFKYIFNLNIFKKLF